MENIFESDKTYDATDFTQAPLQPGEYESCLFKTCDLSNANLSDLKFIDCEFINCNLSMAKLAQTSFRDAVFKECKMLGLRFDTCNEFGLSFRFENCVLRHSVFERLKLKKTTFKECQLQEADFTGSDLTGSSFEKCDLERTIFSGTVLEKADFRTAYGYSIDPESNRIRKARFSFAGLPGLLDKYDIEID